MEPQRQWQMDLNGKLKWIYERRKKEAKMRMLGSTMERENISIITIYLLAFIHTYLYFDSAFVWHSTSLRVAAAVCGSASPLANLIYFSGGVLCEWRHAFTHLLCQLRNFFSIFRFVSFVALCAFSKDKWWILLGIYYLVVSCVFCVSQSLSSSL